MKLKCSGESAGGGEGEKFALYQDGRLTCCLGLQSVDNFGAPQSHVSHLTSLLVLPSGQITEFLTLTLKMEVKYFSEMLIPTSRLTLVVMITKTTYSLTFVAPCIANIFSEYNRQDAMFLNVFISVRRSTCFRRFFRPSSGAQNCAYSVRYLYVEFWAPDDGRKTRQKHAEGLTEIHKLRKSASCWLYSENVQFLFYYC